MRGQIFAVTAIALFCLAASHEPGALFGDEKIQGGTPPALKPAHEPGAVEVRFTDDSVLKLNLRDDKITFLTEYGKLIVPVADIYKVEFATRIPEDVARKIALAIAKLGSDENKEREQAGVELLRFGARAYPALLAAAGTGNDRVKARANELLAQLRERVAEDQLEFRNNDVLWTKDSKFTGKLEGATLQANTFQFGEVQLKLADPRSMHSQAFADLPGRRVAAFADPGTLHEYAGKFEPGAVEARFTDNSVFKLALRDDNITIVTEKGKVVVRIVDLQQIDFAPRIPDDVAKKIAAAIRKLGSEEFTEREQAGMDLLKLGAKAYPALVAATRSVDEEVKRRALDLVATIKDSVAPELLDLREHDVVTTKEGKLTGKIENTILQASTAQFGDVKIKVADIRSLRAQALAAAEAKRLATLTDPSQLQSYAGKFRTRLAFKITGTAAGSVWGSEVYTLDSTLAMAAVHAGALKVGETAVVEIEVVESPPSFTGTTKHGVTTSSWDSYPPGSFKFIVPGK